MPDHAAASIGSPQLTDLQTPGTGHKIDLVLLPGFYLSELAAVTEVVQQINALKQSEVLSLSMKSMTKTQVCASQASVAVSCSAPDFEPGPGLAVFAGGSQVKSHAQFLALTCRKAKRAGRGLVILSDAVSTLHNEGQLKDKPVIVPWDDFYIEGAYWPPYVSDELLYIRHGSLTTCAGMFATYDLMITLLCELAGLPAQTQITDRLKMGDVRTPLARQRKATRDRYRIEHPAFARAVEIMEANLDSPIRVGVIAKEVGLSTRQLERHFNRKFGMSPLQFKRQKQLQKARWLVDNSGMSALEIALSCGFSSATQLSKSFRAFWGYSISELRELAKLKSPT